MIFIVILIKVILLDIIVFKVFDNVTIYLKKLNGKATNEFFILDKSTENVYKHTQNLNYNFDDKITGDSKIKTNDSKTIILPANVEITLENMFVLNINHKQRNIKRVQYIIHEENYDSLNEKYYDLDTGEEVLEDVVAKSFL